MNKKDRQKLILEIITKTDVKTQSDLVIELEKRGVIATQATVSRDIKNLKLIKEISGDGSVYRMPNKLPKDIINSKQELHDIFVKTVTKINRVEYFIVLHTRPGGASNLAFYIDQDNLDGVIGTIAGDDTILVILNNILLAEKLLSTWREWL